MIEMTVDHFANKAGVYEQNKNRVDNVANIAQGILDTIPFNLSMHVIDFGSGTGLLLEKIAPFVGKITAVDISKAMNQQLRNKQNQLGCPVEILEVDLTTADIPFQVDGIISSMTMHHVENIAAMFNKFYTMLKPGGFIAIADLDTEDGSFHTEDTGVFHNGFDRTAFAQSATNAGFQSAKVTSASEIQKSNGAYGVFLLTAFRSA
jgi:cyclopropane fatty-acyl-phospholipid synthase-like methyltransferase